MPTRRAWTLLFLAVAFYGLANQTQVGWLYLFADAFIGFWIVAWLYSLGMLRGLGLSRTLHAPDSPEQAEPRESLPTFHEGDPLRVTLTITNRGAPGVFLVRGEERCPAAPPPEQAQPFFLPLLLRQQQRRFHYDTTCDRRGHFHFPPLRLHSAGPFGLFRRQRPLELPSELLVYPYYHRLKRLPLLESKKFPERQAPRIGAGGEVIGVREYRPGDSPRLIHWRSTARTGQLVVKEFADEEQPALTVALDLQHLPGEVEDKYSPFESALRLAASLGYYATQKGIPFHLAGESPRWSPPRNALSWWGILNYLARVEADGESPYAQLLHKIAGVPLLVALVTQPSEATLQALSTLHRRGTRTLAYLITPDGSPPPALAAHPLSHVEIRIVSPYNWEEELAR